MNCQQCDKTAAIHLTESVDGHRREIHLCVGCARKAGLAPPKLEKTAVPTLDALVQNLIVSNVGEHVGELADLVCPVCGLKFMEYRSSGHLGCPHDYVVFSRGLLPLLVRTQGASRHVGKVANPRPGSAKRLRLRTQLRDAISREDYEAAARFRDQLRLKDADE